MSPQSHADARLPRLRVWERVTDLPLTILAAIFLIAYAIPIIFPAIPQWLAAACHYTDIAVWVLFSLDYLRRLLLSKQKWRFVWRHPLDLAVVLLPPLRPLRLVRSAMLLMTTIDRRIHARPRTRMTIVVGLTAVLLLFIAALAVLDAERGADGGDIHNIGDAAWWAIVTVSTVGYGDLFPVTVEGRVVAMTLMFAGVGMIGFITATVTSWVIEQLSKVDKETADATDATVGLLLDEVRMLRGEVAQLRAELPRRDDTGTG
jgi:voltage-gated potassium channel